VNDAAINQESSSWRLKMQQGIKTEHWDDANGNPEGGSTFGNGFAISWQHGLRR
jgi:hypothetical protein